MYLPIPRNNPCPSRFNVLENTIHSVRTKAAQVTNSITGFKANRSLAPASFAFASTSFPDSKPKLKQALITPASKATAKP